MKKCLLVALIWLVGRIRFLHHRQVVTTWWSCLPAGELVLTDRGYIPIEEVQVGDTVISHTGNRELIEKSEIA